MLLWSRTVLFCLVGGVCGFLMTPDGFGAERDGQDPWETVELTGPDAKLTRVRPPGAPREGVSVGIGGGYFWLDHELDIDNTPFTEIRARWHKPGRNWPPLEAFLRHARTHAHQTVTRTRLVESSDPFLPPTTETTRTARN